MKCLITALFLFFGVNVFAQKTETVFGFNHIQMLYKNDTVDILIKSKKGEENIPKPIFLFCQGSMPMPLIITYKKNNELKTYNTFVFNTDSLSKQYHLVIISKPFIPLIVGENELTKNLCYVDTAGNEFINYANRNYLDYYVHRNIAVLKYLSKQKFITNNKLVVAGHSEGAAIAAKMAYSYKKITHLIYSGGSPLGRVMSNVSRARAIQTDSSNSVESIFKNWQKAIAINEVSDLQYSAPPMIDYLRKLKIPVLITYGTKDYGAVAQNDYLRVVTIKDKKNNFTFKDYIGLEHNFFPLNSNGTTNWDIFNWDKVAEDWQKWLILN